MSKVFARLPPRIRAAGRPARLAALCATALALSTQAATAQRTAHPSAQAPDSLRHIQSIEPRSGPPGTMVQVYTENMPLQARVHIGLGRTGFGWEALAEATQGPLGEVSASVQVPDFATWERPLVFIMFNGIFSPIGLSDPFHVTDEQGRVKRSGRITDEGVGCPMLRDEDDYVYALTGSVDSLRPGDQVVVEGVYAEGGQCGGGSSITVSRLERVAARLR